ncbi:MAG: protein TonB [Alphaproteobacteria bacterium]|jgi:protein TonB
MFNVTRLKYGPFFISVVLHIMLLCLLIPSEVVKHTPQNQIIKVTMVAPTVLKQQASVDITTQRQREIQKQKSAKKVKIKKQVSVEKQVTQKNKVNKGNNKQRLTSGVISKKSVHDVSAFTSPSVASHINNPAPHYPEKARLKKQQGTVLLSVVVQPNGKVEDVLVVKSSGYILLDKAALKTVVGWEFIPAQHNGRDVESMIQIPITFKTY